MLPSTRSRLAASLPVVLVLTLAACQPSPPPFASVEDAREQARAHREVGEAAEAVRVYEWAAEQGDYQAQLELAHYYWSGRFPDVVLDHPGPGSDHARAKKWLLRAEAGMKQAVEAGDVEAKASLALHYADDWHLHPLVEPDSALSWRLLHEAADEGSARALFALGFQARDSDEARAKELFLQAHALGETQALLWAYMPEIGRASEAGDYRRVVELLRLCADGGNREAVRMLEGQLHALRQAADEGNPESQAILADLDAAGLLTD